MFTSAANMADLNINDDEKMNCGGDSSNYYAETAQTREIMTKRNLTPLDLK